jgi:CMP-N-acetylneuraminic acid synthetase
MVAIVPIRSGSKGIPNKNVKLLKGKPLIWWVLNSLQHSNVDSIIVATDIEYQDIIKEFLFSKVKIYIRDSKNSRDTSSTEDVLIEVINSLNIKDDILLAQATSPLTTSNDFDNGIELYKNYDSILSVVNQKRFIWSSQGKSLNYNYTKRPRRQDWEGYYVENGAFYINSSSNILKYRNRLSGNIGYSIMKDITYFEIDSEDDWKIIENIINES